MQHHSGGYCSTFRSIKRVSDDGMSERSHVQSQLMGAPGLRVQFHPALMAIVIQFLPAGEGITALCMTDHLQRAVRPVNTNRQVNAAAASGY